MTRIAFSLGVLALVGCADSAPATLLDGPRVIGVVAEPPTIAVDGATRLTLVTALDGGPATPEMVTWRACSPYALVVDPVRDCTGSAALALEVDAAGRAVLDARALAARFGAPPVVPGDDPCGRAVVPVTVVVEAELAGARLIARKQVQIGVAPPVRQNPVFVQVLADGAPLVDGAEVPAGSTLALSADIAVDSRDLVCADAEYAPTRREDIRVFVLPGGGAIASADRFDVVDDAGATIAGTVELELPAEDASVPLWLVAVDDGGGVGVSHLVVQTRPN